MTDIKFRHLEGRTFLVANEASFRACAERHFTGELHDEDWVGIDPTCERKYPSVVTFYGAVSTTHEPSSTWKSLGEYVAELKAKVDKVADF